MKRILFGLVILCSFASAQQAPRPFLETVSDSISRAFNSTAYTDGDVVTDSVGGAMFFTDDWSRGAVVGAFMIVDTLNTANGTFRLFLYSDTTGIGTLTDNSAFSPTKAKLENLLGVFDLTLTDSGTASATAAYAFWPAATTDFYRYFSGADGIYGILTATGAWVPKHNAQIRLKLILAPAQ